MAKTDSLGIAPFDPAQYLADEASIAEFLNASLDMDDPAVLLNALSVVARARSMTQLAAASGLGRESLYKALAPGAQPRYDTVMRVLHALGVEIALRPSAAAVRKKPVSTRRTSPKTGPGVIPRAAPAKGRGGAARPAAATRSGRPAR